MRKIALGSLILLSACGSQGKGSGGAALTQTPQTAAPTTPSSDHSMLVADASKLPACDASAEGWLVYLKAEGKFQACTSGAWADVDIKGPKGDKGDAGQAGKNFTDQLTQANVSLIKDQAGTNVGFQVTDEKAIVLYTSTVKAPITGLTTGFANQASGYAGYCYYLAGTCSGQCYLDVNLPLFVSTSSIVAPNASQSSFTGSGTAFGSRKANASASCDTSTGTFPTISQQSTYFQGDVLTFTLPFQALSL